MSHWPITSRRDGVLYKISSCSCGWMPAPTETDTERAYAYHVGGGRPVTAADLDVDLCARLIRENKRSLIWDLRYASKGTSLAVLCLAYFARMHMRDERAIKACNAYGREAGRRVVEHGIPHPGHWFEDRA